MKKSCIEWIGDIPNDWNITRVKYIFEESNIRSLDGKETPLSLGKMCGLIPSSLKEQKTLQSESYINAKVVFPGEVVFNRFKARLFAVSKFHGVVSPDYAVYKDRGKHNLRYYTYLFGTEPYRSAFDNKASGIGDGFSRLYTEDLFSMPTILPPLSIQDRIVNYLDDHCDKIDASIQQCKDINDKLDEYRKAVIAKAVTEGIRTEKDFKHNFIEWIDSTPTTWEKIKLKYCLNEINDKNDPIKSSLILSLTNQGKIFPYEERGNQGNKSKEKLTDYKLAYPGTLVLNSMNVIIGSTGISNYTGCISPVYYVYYPQKNVNLRYIYYIFQTRVFQKELRKYANGILEIRLRISSFDMLQLYVPQPSLEEQNSIVAFIDKRCAEIDSAKAKNEAIIKKLEEYKKSLIYNAVTGKIEC